MGAKDWMLVYANGDVRSILRAAPQIGLAETVDLIARLYPDHQPDQDEDENLYGANPPDGVVRAACFPGLTVICTDDATLAKPSTVDSRFLDPSPGRTLYLHAMHSVVDWFAHAVWSSDRTLLRSLSLSPDHGVIENIGDPLPFENPYWVGELLRGP